MSEEVIQDILDALPAIPIHVRELKRQIAMLQESNETMESRILQLEKLYVHWKCANATIQMCFGMHVFIAGCRKNEKWRAFD